MSDPSAISFNIDISSNGHRGSRQSLLGSQDEQSRLFYDGDQIRGHVAITVNSIYHLKYIGIELIGKSVVKVSKVDGSSGGPRNFKHKEIFYRRVQTIVGTSPEPTPSSSGRSSIPPVTSNGRIVQLNKGYHKLPFDLVLESGCTPGSVNWENFSMPSQSSHNASASIYYYLKIVCLSADSTKQVTVCKTGIEVGGFEHSRESLKAMVSKGSGKSKLGNLNFPLVDGNITYAATLDARAYHHGDTALLTLVIDNRLAHPVNGISVKFNNFVSLLGSTGKHNQSSNSVNINLSNSGLLSSSSPPLATDETFSESEILTVVNDRCTVKTNEGAKRAIQIVVPHSAFSTTKYTRSVNFLAYLDVSISVESQTPSVSEKSFQIPIYIINSIPQRETEISPSSSASSGINRSASSTSVDTKKPSIIVWTNDDEVSNCTICRSEFMVLRRRHHCRACGRIMCSKCALQLKVEDMFGPKLQKVCTLCAPELQTSAANPTENASDEPPPTLHLDSSFSQDDFKAFSNELEKIAVQQGDQTSSTLQQADQISSTLQQGDQTNLDPIEPPQSS